jgi:hypothetical protein
MPDRATLADEQAMALFRHFAMDRSSAARYPFQTEFWRQ